MLIAFDELGRLYIPRGLSLPNIKITNDPFESLETFCFKKVPIILFQKKSQLSCFKKM